METSLKSNPIEHLVPKNQVLTEELSPRSKKSESPLSELLHHLNMLKIVSIKTGWNIPAEKGNKTRQTHMLVDPSLTPPCLLEHPLQGTGELWLPSSIPHCSAQCRACTASSTGALPGARKFRFEEKLVCCASLACVRTAWEQGWCVGFRTLHNGYSELLKWDSVSSTHICSEL